MPEVKAGYWWAKFKRTGSLSVIEIKEDRLDLCYPTDSQEYGEDTDSWELLEYIPKYQQNHEIKAGLWYAQCEHLYGEPNDTTIVEVSEDLKHCWAVGIDGWFDLDQWKLLKPVPEYTE